MTGPRLRMAKLAPVLDAKLTRLIQTKGYQPTADLIGISEKTLDCLAYGGQVRAHVLGRIADKLQAVQP